VQTPPVTQALAAGVYDSTVLPMFDTFKQTGVAWSPNSSNSSGSSSSSSQLQQLDIDAVIWATGYNNATQHLLPLGVLGE
jgi:lysine/ornithine N-monooxygenase